MRDRVNKYGLQVDKLLFDFVNDKVLPGTDLEVESFWEKSSSIIKKLTKKNRELLSKRLELKQKIDNWNINNKGKELNHDEYKNFLEEIGYLIKEGEKFQINTTNIDEEIASISGPQLVVPITNARYALNAANARWGSLYDALYGTDAMGSLPDAKEYSVERGNKVIKYAKEYLDEIFPLKDASWSNVNYVGIKDNKMLIKTEDGPSELLNSSQYFGCVEFENTDKKEIILEQNKLKIRIIIDKEDRIGGEDIANISDIYMESAISTIMDCEDSVATVDAEDKVLAYDNWLGLMKGNLSTEFTKENNIIKRKLNKDISYTDKNGNKSFLKGRSLMLIRNVGHLMTNPAILDEENYEIHEGLMDAIFTTLIAIHDLKKEKNSLKNSNTGSIYIVKPKMHGPEEVAFADEIFNEVEKLLRLPQYTVKLGIMDEERRTSVNLYECIRAAKNRVAFINTGFLDRTGDEIHTSMEAGPFLKKGDMKSTKWIAAYENRNVEIGLECGLLGKAQIGKGMWAMPDLMAEMLDKKIDHPKSGANCAWVPSPTAATLHAMHYHKINVNSIQNELLERGRMANLEDLLKVPLAKENWNKEEILREVENNSQSILGYVVRWVDQGVGCSKVPDINDIGLMEDRATCRISSQILSNWLKHNVISESELLEAMNKMAEKVDKQNAGDKKYIPMNNNPDSLSFKAACELVINGAVQPSGYTEPILHKMRISAKKLL